MTDKTITTTIPAGSITAEMVTAGADEVANYYDDGNDLRHREVARFAFQAMLRAAPSPAPAAPSAAQWMPIETAPKDGTEALLYCVPNEVPSLRPHIAPGHWQTSNGLMAPGLWLFRQAVGPSYKPTHWMPLPAAPGAQPAPALEFGYTNYRGEFSQRRAQPIRLYHGSTEWHPEPQWLLEAVDLDKGEVRAFAVKDMALGAQPAQDMTETAKRIAWEMRNRLSICYSHHDSIEGLWGDLITPDREACLSAARAAQPVGEVVDPLDTPLPCAVALPGMKFGKGVKLRALVDAASRWKVIAAKVPLKDMEPALEEARENGILTDMPPAALRSGEGR